MKKIFLLTLISALAVGANAQWHNDRDMDRRAPYNTDRFDRRDSYTSINRINRQFDERAESVRCDRLMSRRERRHQLREIEHQRRRALADYRREGNRHDRDRVDYSRY